MSSFSSPANLSDNREYYLSPETIQDICDFNDKKREKKGKATGILIGIGAAATTLVVLAFTKGLPKNTYKWMEKLYQKAGEKINSEKLKGGKEYLIKFYEKIQNKLPEIADKSRSINNVTSYKDLIFMKLTDKSKVTKKICDKITQMFAKLSLSTVNRKYSNALNKFATLFDDFNKVNKKLAEKGTEQVTINGITKTVNEWLKETASKQNKISDMLQNGFEQGARTKRYQQMCSATKGLEEKVWKAGFGNVDGKGLSNSERIKELQPKKLATTFIAEDILAKDKAKISSVPLQLKQEIHKEIQDILQIYKQLLPEKEYSKITHKGNSLFKIFDKAVNMETSEFFDKLRDLKLGSAPTDMLSIPGATGTVGVGIASADNKDERISALLKYGIPVIGGVTTSLLMTVSLISGFKGLAAGFISGWAMGKAGKLADKARKKYNKKKQDEEFAVNIKQQSV